MKTLLHGLIATFAFAMLVLIVVSFGHILSLLIENEEIRALIIVSSIVGASVALSNQFFRGRD